MRHSRLEAKLMLAPPLVILGVGLLVALSIHAQAAQPALPTIISVTLKSDGDHCVVRDVTILCSDLAAHLRDTLKLPKETEIHLRAGRAAPYQSVRKVLDIIERSGFTYPVAYLTEPKSSNDK